PSSTQQRADALAEHDFRVVIPDFFRGDPWVKMPLVMSEMMEHLNRTVPWTVVDTNMTAVTAHLKAEGSVSVARDRKGSYEGAFDAIAAAHRSQVNEQVLGCVPRPIAFLPSKDEIDFTDMLKKIPAASKNVLVRFEMMSHGFLAARYYTDEDNARCAREAVTILAKFFNKNLHA
ncbi:hypothetical protein BDK51DRAFT_34996, partial [Blyttiomyces helicus]